MTPSSGEQPQAQRRRRIPLWLSAAIPGAIVLGCVFLWFRHKLPSHNQLAGAPALRAEAAQLTSTVVTPHLEEPIQPGRSVLWCSTFQLAWNETCKFAGGDVHMQNEPPMVPVLNKRAARESDVDPAGLLVMSGFVRDGIVAKIRQELGDKFHGQASPDVLNRAEGSLPPDGWVACSYLFRDLPFELVFKRFSRPFLFAGSAKVASFGIRDYSHRKEEKCANQVSVLDYRSDDDFIVELRPKVPDERILLAKIVPERTLQETIKVARERAAAATCRQPELKSEESLVVPVLNFDLLREYKELYDKPITTAGPLKDDVIILALQSVRFRLDERGAAVKSEALVVAKSAAEAPMEVKPRQLLFDKPFLILLERGGADRPYFALWVGGSELLVPM